MKIPPIYAFEVRDLLTIYRFLPVGDFLRRPLMSTLVEDVKRLSFLWIQNRATKESFTWNDWRSFSFRILFIYLIVMFYESFLHISKKQKVRADRRMMVADL
ncbi:hypothetical protein R6Q59_031697 [Mikania micrantha]